MIRKGRFSENKRSMYQCAVFYGKNLLEDLGISDDKRKKKIAKIFKDDTIIDKKYVYPYYSTEIFYSEADALRFLPTFVRNLIEKGLIDSDVLKDNKLDQSRAEAAIVPLQPSMLDDFAG